MTPAALADAIEEREVQGVQTAMGVLPAKSELNLDRLEIDEHDLDKLLTIDIDKWRQEIGFRWQHSSGFDNLPAQIWQAHHRVAQALD